MDKNKRDVIIRDMKTFNIRNILERIWIWLASIYAGLLTLWWLMSLVGSLSQKVPSLFNGLFWVVATLIGVLFVILPLIYWRFYAVLAWGINIAFLGGLSLSMIQLAYVIANDPHYLEDNERIWGPGFHIMHFVLFGVTSLFIYSLKRPALSHIRAIREKGFRNA